MTRSETKLSVAIPAPGIGLNWGGWGGGYSHFSSHVGSGPASTVHPKKYQEFQAPQINIWNFSNPKNILYFVPWPSEKTLKCIV